MNELCTLRIDVRFLCVYWQVYVFSRLMLLRQIAFELNDLLCCSKINSFEVRTTLLMRFLLFK